MPQQAFSETYPILNHVKFITADGTAVKVLLPASANPRRVDSLMVVNTDTIAHGIRFYVTDALAQDIIGSVHVPLWSAVDPITPVDAVPLLFSTQINGLWLPASYVLAVSIAEAVASGLYCSIWAYGGE